MSMHFVIDRRDDLSYQLLGLHAGCCMKKEMRLLMPRYALHLLVFHPIQLS